MTKELNKFTIGDKVCDTSFDSATVVKINGDEITLKYDDEVYGDQIWPADEVQLINREMFYYGTQDPVKKFDLIYTSYVHPKTKHKTMQAFVILDAYNGHLFGKGLLGTNYFDWDMTKNDHLIARLAIPETVDGDSFCHYNDLVFTAASGEDRSPDREKHYEEDLLLNKPNELEDLYDRKFFPDEDEEIEDTFEEDDDAFVKNLSDQYKKDHNL